MREKSSCRNVGASDGGIETMPLYLHEAERQADERHREDADQRAADDVAVIERDDQHEAERGTASPAIA